MRPMGLCTFENPEHGNFKSQILVQDLLMQEGWMLFFTDYCAVASAHLGDGVQPKKRTIVLGYGLGEVGELPTCAGRFCPMVVLHTGN